MRLRLRSGLRFCALILAYAASPVFAAGWNYGTRLGLYSDWNDNPALADDTFKTDSTFRLLASYDGEFAREDDASAFNVRPRITTDYYLESKNRDLQSTDIFLPGSFNYRRPLTSWTMGFNASRQSVLSDEATTAQENVFRDLRADDTLTQFGLTPSLLWRLSEKDELQLGLSWSISDYDLEFTNRSDTDSVGANFFYRRNLNERHAVGVSGLLNSSDSERRAVLQILPPTDPPTFVEGKITTDATSNYFTADYSYAVTDTSMLNVSYGVQDATTESEIIGPVRSAGTNSLDFNSSTYDISYQFEGPRAEYLFGISRIVTLDITNGQPQDRYQVNFDGEYQLTERLLGGVRILAWKQESVAVEIIDENNNRTQFSRELLYGSAQFRLDWQLSRKWYLNTRYEYRRRDDDQNVGNVRRDFTAISNQVAVGVSYVWKELPRR